MIFNKTTTIIALLKYKNSPQTKPKTIGIKFMPDNTSEKLAPKTKGLMLFVKKASDKKRIIIK